LFRVNLAQPDLSNAPLRYDLISAFWGVYFKMIGVEYRHLELVPMTGPAIIAPNHITNIDPFGVAQPLPRRVHFMAKQELFGNAVLRYYMLSGNAFPVERGKMDLTAIKTALRVLQNGQLLVIFPQGTRGGVEAKGGASFLALKAKVPVIPVGISLHRNWFGGKAFRFNFGTPIPPEGDVEAHTTRVSDAIEALRLAAS
jgi:1-acyl-sn-glycerol-3-phosphate acyltransferase